MNQAGIKFGLTTFGAGRRRTQFAKYSARRSFGDEI